MSAEIINLRAPFGVGDVVRVVGRLTEMRVVKVSIGGQWVVTRWRTAAAAHRAEFHADDMVLVRRRGGRS